MYFRVLTDLTFDWVQLQMYFNRGAISSVDDAQFHLNPTDVVYIRHPEGKATYKSSPDRNQFAISAAPSISLLLSWNRCFIVLVSKETAVLHIFDERSTESASARAVCASASAMAYYLPLNVSDSSITTAVDHRRTSRRSLSRIKNYSTQFYEAIWAGIYWHTLYFAYATTINGAYCIVLHLSFYIAPLNSHRQIEALLVRLAPRKETSLKKW